MDVEDRCVLCGEVEGTKNNLVNSRLMTNAAIKCGHRFCQRCIEKEFLQKRQFYCKLCGSAVKRNTLTDKSVLEIEVERDFKIRRRIKEIYNKIQDDFGSHREYCDYEEMVEDIIYNLTESIDLEATNAKVEKYKKENEELIISQQTKRQDDAKNQQANIQNEKRQMELLQMNLKAENEKERRAKRDLINQTNQIMLGDRDSVSVSSRFTGAADSAAAPAPKASIVPNHVQMFFMQREEPKPIFKMRDTSKGEEPKRILHNAGGLDPSITFKRNFAEARVCFDVLNLD